MKSTYSRGFRTQEKIISTILVRFCIIAKYSPKILALYSHYKNAISFSKSHDKISLSTYNNNKFVKNVLSVELYIMTSSGMLYLMALLRTPLRNIPEDDILHSHRRENLKTNNLILYYTM
jgi:hypothetical protein